MYNKSREKMTKKNPPLYSVQFGRLENLCFKSNNIIGKEANLLIIFYLGEI